MAIIEPELTWANMSCVKKNISEKRLRRLLINVQ